MGVGVAAHVGPQDLCADFGFSSGETGPPCRTFNERVATHSSILAWRIPWTEEPGGLLSMGSHRVGHD